MPLSYNVTAIGTDEHAITIEVMIDSKNNEPLETLTRKPDRFTYNFIYDLDPDFSQLFIKFKKGDTEIETIRIPFDGVIDLEKPKNNLVISEGYVLRK